VENELAEAIQAEDRVRIADLERLHRSFKDDLERPNRSFKNNIVGFLILFGVGIAWMVYRQSSEMARHSEILNTQAQRLDTVSETARQAKQLTMQNAQDIQAIRDQMRSEQRAWVGLTNISMRALTADQPVWITANTVNSGKTLALHAQRTNAIVLATKEPASFPMKGKWKALDLFTPNLIYRDIFKGTERLNQAQIDAINSGELLVFMYGTLKYDDIVGTPHSTDYCVVYTADTSGFSSCKKHNSAN